MTDNVEIRVEALRAAAWVHQPVPGGMTWAARRSTDAEVIATAEVFERWIREGGQPPLDRGDL